MQSLMVQGKIIAGVIAGSGSGRPTPSPSTPIGPQAGEGYGPSDDALFGYEFPVNPERIAPLLRRLITPTRARARIYDLEGSLILDSRRLFGGDDAIRFEPAPLAREAPNIMQRSFIAVRTWHLPPYRELAGDNGKGYPEINKSFNDQKVRMVGINEGGEAIVQVAVPIQRSRTVQGALLLSTENTDIDDQLAAAWVPNLGVLAFSLLAALFGTRFTFCRRCVRAAAQ
jgi:two-component system sensor histidine kinase ChvG